jgi:N-acetyl-alpha-D-muramate 1-phosphate uridylyltransferase
MVSDPIKPTKAFILAAGFGTRLRPYTDHCPKPMVQVAGRSLIYRTLDKLAEAGVQDVMVNLHYMADVLRAHLEAYPQNKMKIHTSFEPEILNTGGGITNVLPFFGDEPFYVIAGDALWTDGNVPALEKLAQQWDGQRMDILTLMQPLNRMTLTGGAGDYDLLAGGHVKRSVDKAGTHMWTNIRLNHPRIYRSAPQGAFSFLDIMDACEREKRFLAIEHDGDWHHISTPKDLEAVDEAFIKADEGEA